MRLNLTFLHKLILAWVLSIPVYWSMAQPLRSESQLSQAGPEIKAAAFEVLKAKCNVCHIKKNPRRVFTLDNMSQNAERIHKQVFVKKRMPKGKANQLNPTEMQTLKQWLFTEID